MPSQRNARREHALGIGLFHTVRKMVNGKTVDYEVYFENQPYMKVSKKLGGMSRAMARAFVKLLNGEGRWP